MLIVVRHGRTESNARGVLLGREDVELDPLGREQARALAAVVPRPDRVITSPLRRTMATAEVFGVAVETDERWIELDYGEYDGQLPSELPEGTWDRWRGDLGFAPPGGESLAALGQRVEDACLDLVEAASRDTVVVVSHVSPIKAAMCWALGVTGAAAWRSYVSPASITRIGIQGTTPVLVSFNDTAHLD